MEFLECVCYRVCKLLVYFFDLKRFLFFVIMFFLGFFVNVNGKKREFEDEDCFVYLIVDDI